MPYNFKVASFQSWKFHQPWARGLLCGLSLLLVGCNPRLSTPVAPLPTPSAVVSLLTNYATDDEAITALILTERQAAIDHHLSVLEQLWADDAQIIDGRNSAAVDDDYHWVGRAAILDRYRVAVFPFVLPPLPALAESTVITITGDHATVQHLTDLWQLRKAEGRWWLSELKYSYQP